MPAVDVIALAIVSLAVLRGLFIGVIREGFSIVALGGAVMAVRLFTDPLAAWLRHDAGVELGDFTLRVASAVILVVGVVGAVVIAGKILRRGVRAAGLGWADRLGGGVLGTAEGLLVVALLMAGAIAAVGRDHTALTGSQTLVAYEEARELARRTDVPSDPSDLLDRIEAIDGLDVAAPPR